MKKILMSISALALMFVATSCEPEDQKGNGGIDFDEIALDGFYVYGEATGSEDITADYGMAACLNEVTAEKRVGMY